MRILMALLPTALLCANAFAAPESGVIGYWKEPGGSVIHVERCGLDLCATLVAISPTAPTRMDAQDPNPKLRHRPLCGLRIGQGFHLVSPTKAEGGSLYDPKTGKTYQGTMKSYGVQLDLRGYIGLPIFGRTERWVRTAPVSPCRI